MTNGGASRSLGQRIILKVGFPVLIGLVTLMAARVGGMSGRNSLLLAAAVIAGSALVLFTVFLVDTDMRIAAVREEMAAGFAKIGHSAEPPITADRSILDGAQLKDLLHAEDRVNPLLRRLAQRESERVADFVRQLPAGEDITYEGEDRDWLLGLTREAKRSIDAISLSTVDAGVRGLDGGLWTSDLGIRYLDLQRQAIARNVRIRRVFVFENAEMARGDETFQWITHLQRDIGVEVRMLDHEFIPDWMKSMIFDFIVFDGTVSYETTPATPFAVGQTRPGILRTRLAPMPDRIRELEERFEQLWEAADPDRKID